jgi:hypothetical protein
LNAFLSVARKCPTVVTTSFSDAVDIIADQTKRKRKSESKNQSSKGLKKNGKVF